MMRITITNNNKTYALIQPDPCDLKTVGEAAAIDTEAFGNDGTSIFNMALFARSKSVFCLLDSENKVVGEAAVFRNIDGIGAVVYCFAVEKKHRGTGLGTSMMRSILEQCRKMGIKFVELTMNPENTPAEKVYMERNGFVKTAELPLHPITKERRWLLRVDL